MFDMISKNDYNKLSAAFKRNACVGGRELHLIVYDKIIRKK